MSRVHHSLALLTGVALLAVAWMARLGSWERLGTGAPDAHEQRWDVWRGMGVQERQTAVREFQEISRRVDADDVWRRAEAFRRADGATRERLREAYIRLEGAIESRPPAERRWLRSLQGAARARAAFQHVAPRGASKAQGVLPERG
ncbi:MAG: hypothetical protein CHACPFDD_02930 [Phycisphaerae bacterium]|nr:hypothetical protein [Phycisphaerae bacterium]